jgi:hypothetical protein
MRSPYLLLCGTLLGFTLVHAADVALPAGTTVVVRTIDAIDSSSADVGKTFRGSLDAPLILDGQEVAHKGSDASLKIIEATSAGKIKGKAALTVTLVSVNAGTQTLQVNSATVSVESAGKGKGSAVKIGAGAVAGAALGAILGGAKGAAIGAAAGGGAGTAAAMLTGPHVKIPSETVLTFKVQ